MSEIFQGLDLQERPVPQPRRLTAGTHRFITVAVIITVTYAVLLGFLSASVALSSRELFVGQEALVLTLLSPVGELLQLAGHIAGGYAAIVVGPATGSFVAASIMFVGGVVTGIGQGALVAGILFALGRLVARLLPDRVKPDTTAPLRPEG